MTIDYNPTTSIEGLTHLLSQNVDFACVDSYLSAQDYALSEVLATSPSAAIAYTPVYNLPELDSDSDLPRVLDRVVLANIFLGVIDNWNHSTIRATNPSITKKLPNRLI